MAPAAATFKDSTAAWRASPGKYAYFGAGPGSFGHVWFAKLLTQQKWDEVFSFHNLISPKFEQ